MRVSDLQQFLTSLAAPLQTSGAKGAAKDLEQIASRLEVFRAMTLTQFGDFLTTAEEYKRNGVLKPTSTRRKKAPPKDPEATKKSTERLLRLKRDATTGGVGFEEIDAAVGAVNKAHTKAQVLEIAHALEIPGGFRTKKDAVEEIRRQLRARRESYSRTRF